MSGLLTLPETLRLEDLAPSTRELALMIWVGLLLAAASVNAGVRRAAGGVVGAFLQPAIVTALTMAGVYIAVCAALLSAVGLWDWPNLKTTLVWAATFAFVTMFDVQKLTTDKGAVGQMAKDTVAATTFVVFVAEFYTLPLAVELAIFPAAVFVSLGKLMSEQQGRAAATRFFNGAASALGLLILGWALYMVIKDRANFFTWATMRELLVPMLLSFLFLPFLIVLATWYAYETATLRINWALSDKRLRRYAARRAFLVFRNDFDLLSRWTRNIANHPPQSRQAVETSLREVKRLAALEATPPPVAPDEGWSPNVARTFLTDLGLVPGDYHALFDEWFAATPLIEIGEDILPDNIAYYVEGDEAAARRLKLKLNINSPGSRPDAESRFSAAALQLVERGVSSAAADAVRSAGFMNGFDLQREGRRIWLVRDNQHTRGGHTRILQVDYEPGYPSEYDRLLSREGDR